MSKVLQSSLFLQNQRLKICTSSYKLKRYYSDSILPATSYITSDVFTPVKIRMEDTAPGNYPPILVQTMIRNAVKKHGDKTAIVSCDGKIRWNYNQYQEEVQKAAKGFVTLGLDSMHGVGIMGHNHQNWMVSSLAAVYADGLACGLYTTNSPTTVKYICETAPLDLLVIQNNQILEKMLKIEPEINNIVKKFVVMDPKSCSSTGYPEKVLSWNELMEIGNEVDNKVLTDIESKQSVNQACMLQYTSGTTGPPKGVMLSHDNVTWTSRICMEQYNWNQERLLSYLPLSHTAGIMIDCHMAIYAGNEVHFSDEEVLKTTLVENLKRVRPTRIVGVPRVWEKIAEKMQEAGKANSGLKKVIGNWAKKVATKHHTMIREGKMKPSKNDFQYALAKKIVFNRIHEALGLDQTKNDKAYPGTMSGAAPLNMETFNYFQSIDLLLPQLYGCSETNGPSTTNMSGSNCKPASTGRSYIGVNNTILNPDEDGIGEIGVRSRNVFMGYHKDPFRTKEAFQDGWFRTGDLGKFDTDGFLWVSGRSKELIITSGGENIAPIPIENNILAELSDIVSNVMVIGDGRKYLTCLISLKCTLDQDGIPTNLLDAG